MAKYRVQDGVTGDDFEAADDDAEDAGGTTRHSGGA